MITFIVNIVILCIGIQIGWHLCRRHVSRTIDNLLEDFKTERTGTEVSLEIKKIGDVFFAYDKHEGGFLAQADGMKSLAEALHDRFPGKLFILDLKDDIHVEE